MTDADMKVLWSESGKLCCICHQVLVEKKSDKTKYPLGEMAHIKGEKPKTPRYDPKQSHEERDSETNRILLCPTCHTKIDKDGNGYSVEELHKIKDEHIAWIEKKLRISVSNITFAELEVIIKYLVASPMRDKDFQVITSQEKIKKNMLSEQVDKYIKIGLMQRKQVMDYLNKNADPQFSERLKGGFTNKYKEYKGLGQDGNEIFYNLLDFSSNYSDDFEIKAAGLAVLAYFFELCDIFEK